MMHHWTPNENIWDIEGRKKPDEIEYCGHYFPKDADKVTDADRAIAFYDPPRKGDGFPARPYSGGIKKKCCMSPPPLPPGTPKTHFEIECSFDYDPSGIAFYDVSDFARENKLFLKYYLEAWTMATENGHDKLKKNTDYDDEDRFPVPANWTQDCYDAYENQGVC